MARFGCTPSSVSTAEDSEHLDSVENLDIKSDLGDKNSCENEEKASNACQWDFEDDGIDVSDSFDNVTCGPSVLDKPCLKQNSDDIETVQSYTVERCSDNIQSSSGWDFDEDFPVAECSKKAISSNYKDETNPKECQKSSSSNTVWGSWSNWGVSNLISTASEGVSSISNQMTSGFTSILENTLGAPDPVTMACQLSAEKTENEQSSLNQPEENSETYGLSNIFGGVSSLSNKVIFGGLDTLETLGKKTMEVLQEGDPGLKKKRALFQGNKVILSQVLRDAKEKAEANETEQINSKFMKRVQYETLFDDFHGLVHLEALEMISKQCELKIQFILSDNHKYTAEEFNKAINYIKKLYEQSDTHDESDSKSENDVDLKEVIVSSIDLLSLSVNFNNLIEVDSSIQCNINVSNSDGSTIHTSAISDLAHFSAASIELFHRIGELLIVKDVCNVDSCFEALHRIANVTKLKINTISEKYSAKLMLLNDKSSSPLITNVFLEASNSLSYLENAFELFAPVLQLKALDQGVSTDD